jgi:hypothetical protein
MHCNARTRAMSGGGGSSSWELIHYLFGRGDATGPAVTERGREAGGERVARKTHTPQILPPQKVLTT